MMKGDARGVHDGEEAWEACEDGCMMREGFMMKGDEEEREEGGGAARAQAIQNEDPTHWRGGTY